MQQSVIVLEGKLLEYAAAIAAGEQHAVALQRVLRGSFKPLSDWSQLGSLIRHARIQWWNDDGIIHAWCGFNFPRAILLQDQEPPKKGECVAYGPTIEVAVLRVFVLSRKGLVVDVPDELR